MDVKGESQIFGSCMKTVRNYILKRKQFGVYFLLLLLLIITGGIATAQCPANIDFETGTFNGWTCWTGSVNANGGQNNILINPVPGPVSNRHEMLSASIGNGLDKYGQFPQNCPNGSNYSIRLGNDVNGLEADAVSYDFTVPSNNYKFIYNYAVVVQDPDHLDISQPRFKVVVLDVTDNVEIDCSSFLFIPHIGMKGFVKAPFQGSAGTPVLYKDWSAATINLNNYQGKTIRIFFTTTGCTYTDHFCYTYIDVSRNCTGTLDNNNFCSTDTAANLKAPVGFENYKWFNNNFTQSLGAQQTLQVKPLPAAGTVFNVEVTPKDGYGCIDTLTVQLQNSLTVSASAGPDKISCNAIPVQLGSPALPGLNYTWSPVTGLNNPKLSNPSASPSVSTSYVVSVRSEGGGCLITDTVNVNAINIDNSMSLIGNPVYCIGSGPFPELRLNFADKIQWFKDSVPVIGANQTRYTVQSSGKYYAQLFNNACALPVSSKEMSLFVDVPQPGITYPVKDAVFNFPLKLQARTFGKTVTWAPSTNLDYTNIYAPTFRGLNPQLYTITIETATGCITVDTQYVRTVKKIDIFVPTAFTPNGDGINDYLRPVLMGISKVNYFRVYNRLGNLNFEMKSDLPGWDGKINNVTQNTQSVVWTMEAVDVDGGVHFRQGTAVLLR
jgi:gliding motility-associated-like protein